MSNDFKAIQEAMTRVRDITIDPDTGNSFLSSTKTLSQKYSGINTQQNVLKENIKQKKKTTNKIPQFKNDEEYIKHLASCIKKDN